jgi:hypothetical protein
MATVGVMALVLGACSMTVDSTDEGPGTDAPADVVSTLGEPMAQAIAQAEMARRSYEDVVATLGPVAPFGAIARAEAADAAAVRAAARAHGMIIGDEPVPGSPAPADRTSACLLAVEIEKSTIATYDELLPKVQAFPDVTRLFTRVRATARNDHLPAFERCGRP